MRLVLDAEAVSALLDPRHPAERKVRQAMEAARRLRRDVAIATGTLGDGALLTQARADSALFADAHPVAVAVEAGGGVIQTADPDDLGRLAAPYRTVVVEPVSRGPGRRRRRGGA